MSRRRTTRHDRQVSVRRLRVGFFISAIHCGGVERWVASLAGELANSHCAVTGVLTRSVTPDGIRMPCKVYGMRDAAAFFSSCDVVIAWFFSAEDAKLLSQFKGPVYGVSHGSYENKWSTDMCQIMLQVPQIRPVAVSRAAAQAFGLGDTRIPIIYNGVGLDRSVILRDPELREEAGFTDKRVILYYGRLSSEKRPDLVAEMMRYLDPARYVTIICGPITGDYIAQIPRVEGTYVLKPTCSPKTLFALADCTVNFSNTESFCLSLFEAMAARLPTFTSRWAVSDELEDILGEPLLTTPIDATPQELAAFVKHHLDTPDLARASRLQETVFQKFSVSYMASQWEKLLGVAPLAYFELHDHVTAR